MPFRRLHLLFVYGSLRRGRRHHRLLAGAPQLGAHRTPPRYTLLDLGAYPGAVEGGRTRISGEVYRVSARRLAVLDRFEGCPAEYRRGIVATPWGAAWIYLLRAPRRARRLRSGDWRRHRR